MQQKITSTKICTRRRNKWKYEEYERKCLMCVGGRSTGWEAADRAGCVSSRYFEAENRPKEWSEKCETSIIVWAIMWGIRPCLIRKIGTNKRAGRREKVRVPADEHRMKGRNEDVGIGQNRSIVMKFEYVVEENVVNLMKKVRCRCDEDKFAK